MFSKIHTTKFSSLPTEIKQQLRQLNLRDGGLMLPTIRAQPDIKVSIIYEGDSNFVVAWSLLDMTTFVGPHFMVYTRKPYRRMGLARRLYFASKRRVQKMHVYNGEKNSYSFYKEVGAFSSLGVTYSDPV